MGHSIYSNVIIFFIQVSSDLGQMHFVECNDYNDGDLLRECVKYSDVVVNLTGT